MSEQRIETLEKLAVACRWMLRLQAWFAAQPDLQGRFLPSAIADELIEQWPHFVNISGPMKYDEAQLEVENIVNRLVKSLEPKGATQ